MADPPVVRHEDPDYAERLRVGSGLLALVSAGAYVGQEGLITLGLLAITPPVFLASLLLGDHRLVVVAAELLGLVWTPVAVVMLIFPLAGVPALAGALLLVHTAGRLLAPGDVEPSRPLARAGALGAAFAGGAGTVHGLVVTYSTVGTMRGPVIRPGLSGSPFPLVLLVLAVLLFVTWGWTSAHLSLSAGLLGLLALGYAGTILGSDAPDVAFVGTMAFFGFGLLGMVAAGVLELYHELDVFRVDRGTPNLASDPESD